MKYKNQKQIGVVLTFSFDSCTLLERRHALMLTRNEQIARPLFTGTHLHFLKNVNERNPCDLRLDFLIEIRLEDGFFSVKIRVWISRFIAKSEKSI